MNIWPAEPHLSDLLRLRGGASRRSRSYRAVSGDQQRHHVAHARREARFNSTSKWLKAVSHDASNILIQIKGVMRMRLSPWIRPCWWALYWVPPDGIVIDIQLDCRSKPLNVLYLDQWHICQGHNLHSSIWIHWKGVSGFTHCHRVTYWARILEVMMTADSSSPLSSIRKIIRSRKTTDWRHLNIFKEAFWWRLLS